MLINLLSQNSKPVNFPNTRGTFSEISQSNRTISKIVTLVKAIVLFPINLVKDVAYHVTRPFKKAAEPSLKDRVITALNIVKQKSETLAEKTREFANKNKETIVRVSLAALALGGAYTGYSYVMPSEPEPINKWIIAGGVVTSLILGFSAYKSCFNRSAVKPKPEDKPSSPTKPKPEDKKAPTPTPTQPQPKPEDKKAPTPIQPQQQPEDETPTPTPTPIQPQQQPEDETPTPIQPQQQPEDETPTPIQPQQQPGDETPTPTKLENEEFANRILKARGKSVRLAWANRRRVTSGTTTLQKGFLLPGLVAANTQPQKEPPKQESSVGNKRVVPRNEGSQLPVIDSFGI